MTIFNFFTMFGGLAFFLYGMKVMSSGLEKMAGGKLEKTLRRMTDNPLKSIALGAGITIAIQSSSALTVMLVGLVNSGIMTLTQTIGVIMGSNIGTTLTAWIFSLAGIESSNFFIRLLKPESFSPVVAFAGVLLIFLGKRSKHKDMGGVMVGFAVLMFGMQLMSGSVSPLADDPEFAKVLTMFANPLLGVITGAAVTGLIQSSAASVGILQALSMTGSLSYAAAVPLIMGQNIGTCVTSLISSIGTSKNAKRVAAVHIYFNVIGTVICLALYFILNALLDNAFAQQPISPVGIAIVHSIFNITTTACLLPFGRFLEKLARRTVRDKKDGTEVEIPAIYLDERLLKSPSFALPECRNATVTMSKLCRESMFSAIDLLYNYDPAKVHLVEETEQAVDKYEDMLGSYLVKLSSRSLNHSASKEISKLLLTIGDFERISDHALGVGLVAEEMHQKNIRFSEQAMEELQVMTDALVSILDLTISAFKNNDAELAAQIEPLEQVIDDLRDELKLRHIQRLQAGQCTIELGFIFSDLLTHYQRVSDHCSNIGVCIIQIKDSNFDTHGYLNEIKTGGDVNFVTSFNKYRQQFTLPPNRPESELPPDHEQLELFDLPEPEPSDPLQ